MDKYLDPEGPCAARHCTIAPDLWPHDGLVTQMCDHWMPVIELPLTIKQFHALPRNAAYKYEYSSGRAILSPRARHYHALLDLQSPASSTATSVKPLEPRHWLELEALFAAAFCPIQPFACLDDVTRREAAHASLERTRTGGDGPLIEPASFVAMENDELLGAILVTLLPEGDPCDINSYEWREPPPADCIARRLGRPHLTWIFVSPFRQGFGTGSGLLDAAVRALLDLGYKDLLSTFMLGNDSSTLWHWRNGFRLLAYPASHRLLQERWRERIKEPRTK